MALCLLTACAVPEIEEPAQPQPQIEIRTWAADFTTESIRRKQENYEIKCGEPRFSDFVCLDYSDLMALKFMCPGIKKR